MLLDGKKVKQWIFQGKTMDFSETIVVYDLKLATDDRSDKKFLLTSKLCPLGAVCSLPRGYLYVLNHEKYCIKSDSKRFLWNLQQMGKWIRSFCWHQNFVRWGLSAPAQVIYTCINPSHAAIKISINATAAGFICKNIFPTPVQLKKNIKNKIGDIQQIYLFKNVCTVFRHVLYTVFFLQLQCKKVSAYNITDHLTFCCCRNPGWKNLESRNYMTKAKLVNLTYNPWKKTFSDCFQLN